MAAWIQHTANFNGRIGLHNEYIRNIQLVDRITKHMFIGIDAQSSVGISEDTVRTAITKKHQCTSECSSENRQNKAHTGMVFFFSLCKMCTSQNEKGERRPSDDSVLRSKDHHNVYPES